MCMHVFMYMFVCVHVFVHLSVCVCVQNVKLVNFLFTCIHIITFDFWATVLILNKT